MLRVLIVDDEQFVRVSLRALYDWEANGFEIVGTADNGLEALEQIEALRPDILITDIVMPGMDGLQLLEQIQSRSIQVTTLIISNLGDLENVRLALRLGAADYFLKVHFEREAFDRVMHRIREAALTHAGADQQISEAPAAENPAEEVARAMSGHEDPRAQVRHAFVIRVQRYGSEQLSSFAKIYQPLSNLVLETFKAYPSTRFAPAPVPDALLVTVADPIPAHVISRLLKQLDAQLMIYLSAAADLLHFPSPNGSAPMHKLRNLSRYLPERGHTPVLYDDVEQSAPQSALDRAQRYIDEHIDQRLTLPQIASHVGLNPSYLSRAFAQKTGMPLIAHINERKMQKAALLLTSGKHKIKDVATLLGYDDQYYFTRLFTKTHGLSPSEYMASKEESP